MLQIEIAYASPKKQIIETLQVPEGSTLQQVLDSHLQTYLHRHFPETSSEEKANFSFGIFSKPQTSETLLKNQDRIEIYRPLLVDPMKKRSVRQNAQGLKHISR